MARLKELGIPFGAGQCLIDADASSAHRLLDVIREFELPIVLLFNRSRVMALAQGVSKATGLNAALDILRASPRNTVAIGDAENDHELLRLAEVGAAVEWGSPSLQAAADVVIAGNSPDAVGTSSDVSRRAAGYPSRSEPDGGSAYRTHGRRSRFLPRRTGTQRADRRRLEFRQVMAGGAAVRAPDSPRVQPVCHRS